eukprot:TRINITY_DN4387_c0_g1_i1.p1 TRINITY_DN4387_c0_g1~~TRINITY_DN4387_c0_g1_i1.p1  ORF type:complete len:424 (+),score=55.21 TRINITY_DN4387_c0_g1_i1:486-1757(+)
MLPLTELCPIGLSHDPTKLSRGVAYRMPLSYTIAKESSLAPSPLFKDPLQNNNRQLKEEDINTSSRPKTEEVPKFPLGIKEECTSCILPGLPDDVAKHCLALIPRSDFSSLRCVSKTWRKFIGSKEFYMARKLVGMLEEWIYILTTDSANEQMRWQVLDSSHGKWEMLPPMPGPPKIAFGYVVLNQKLIVLGGLICHDDDTLEASADVYQYDPVLNRWTCLSKMNMERYEFGCAVVEGQVYAVGGHGRGGESVSSVEVYEPEENRWSLIESIRRPRWGCFASGLEGKLYVMGGRSSFTIGNSRYVDIYDPQAHAWNETKNGCVMVVAHAVLNQRLFCIEWKNDRQLAIYEASSNSWQRVAVPFTRSLTISFCLGTLEGKLLLFSTKPEPSYDTLMYDPAAHSWNVATITPPAATCISCVTITT